MALHEGGAAVLLGEAEVLVERAGGGVAAVDVELDAPAAALAGAVDGGLDHRAAEAGPAGLLGDEEVLEPAVLAGGLDREAVAQLGDSGRRRVVVRRAQQVLGVALL